MLILWIFASLIQIKTITSMIWIYKEYEMESGLKIYMSWRFNSSF